MINAVFSRRALCNLTLVATIYLAAVGIASPAAEIALRQPDGALAILEGKPVVDTLNLTYEISREPAADAEPVLACETNCGQCRRCRPKPFLVAGAEATFLVPEFHATALSSTITNIGASTSNVYSTSVSDLENMYVGPRVWLGVQGERWGVVGRFWQLSDSQFATDPLMPGETTGFTAGHRFDLYTADVELTRQICLGKWRMELGVGARHGSVDYDSTLLAYELVGTDLLTASAVASHRFDGTGFTVGLQGRRPIYSARRTNLYLFWNARGSLLWGEFSNAVQSASTYSGGAGVAYNLGGAVASTNDDLFIGEAQLGFQYERRLRCMPAKAFIRAAAEYQNWDGDGATAFATTGVLASGIASGVTTASSSDARLNLVGFTLGAGLSW